MKNILFAASEAFPFFKSGGLGDVAGALPKYINCPAYRIRGIMPKFRQIPEKYTEKMEFVTHFEVPLGWRRSYCGLFRLKLGGIVWYFLDNEYYFYRDKAYGEYDDAERMAFFSKAVLEAIPHLDFDVDILHANDWHTAMVPVFLREHYNHLEQYRKIKTVFTIHNLKFQGQYDPFVLGDILGLMGTPAEPQLLTYKDGRRESVNYMQGAVCYADRITTVSPTYAEEIRMPYYGENLDWLFRKRSDVLSGILNGIDTKDLDPAADVALPYHYDLSDLSGKAKDKKELQKELGLAVDPCVPVYAIISRLTEQKGLDLVTYILPEIEKRSMQLVILGVGDAKYEEAFRYYGDKNPGKICAKLCFDEGLSRRIYAGADALLVPSRFEPCGLTQMMAMRYGTLPIVRETGGLKDTVEPYNEYEGTGTGFSFANFNAGELLSAIDLSLTVYGKKKAWNSLRIQAMQKDLSWRQSAKAYRKLYKELTS